MRFYHGAKLSPDEASQKRMPFPLIQGSTKEHGATVGFTASSSPPPQCSFTAPSLLLALCRKGSGCQPNISSKAFIQVSEADLTIVGSCFPLGLLGSRRVVPSSDPAEWLGDHPVPVQGNETHPRPRWVPTGKAQRLPARGGGHRGKEGAAPWGARATPPSQDGYQLPHREANRRGHGFAFWGMFAPRKSGRSRHRRLIPMQIQRK